MNPKIDNFLETKIIISVLCQPARYVYVTPPSAETNQTFQEPKIYIYIHIYIYIQGDSGGICTTWGNDSMSDSKQISSYEQGSDFERLRSYGHFLIPVHALM